MTLQEKARVALQTRAAHDPRWNLLVLRLALRTGLDPRTIERKIEELAE